jgi:hypothetical protein
MDLLDKWALTIEGLERVDWGKVETLDACLQVMHALLSACYVCMIMPKAVSELGLPEEGLAEANQRIVGLAGRLLELLPRTQINLDAKAREASPGASLIVKPFKGALS